MFSLSEQNLLRSGSNKVMTSETHVNEMQPVHSGRPRLRVNTGPSVLREPRWNPTKTRRKTSFVIPPLNRREFTLPEAIQQLGYTFKSFPFCISPREQIVQTKTRKVAQKTEKLRIKAT